MIVGVIVKEAVALLLIVLGLVLWIGRKVSIIHAYQYKNVKEKDIPAYCRMVGIGLIVIGGGLSASGILDIFYSSLWWIPLLAGFCIGLTVLFIAQKKYNGSIMG